MARREPRPRRDIHAEITETILAQLRDGIRPWMRPWDSGADGAHAGAGLPLRDTGQPYSGINVLVLWAAAAAAGYGKPTWMTFKQAKAHGGRVRKGEKGQRVVYAGRHETIERDPDTGAEKERKYGFLKTFTVFNVEQIDGLGERWHRTYAEIHPVNRERRREELDGFFTSLGIDVRHGGDEAYYVLSEDYIQLPRYELFHDAEAYYTTLAHESIHWTRHASRLNRTFRGSHQVPYAKEELVAEIGSAFLAAELGIAPAIRDDHADYVGAWLRILEDDNKAIFRAASHASKAVAWLRDRGQAVTADLSAGIDAGESPAEVTEEAQPALPLDEETTTAWPDRGVGPDAVQGELFRAPPAALATRSARQLVADAQAWRAAGRGEGEAKRLLAAAERVNLETPGVAQAIEAAAVLQGAAARGGGLVKADVFLRELRADARRDIEATQSAGRQIHSGRSGVSF